VKFGQLIALLASATIPLWRALVVGINDLAAIVASRWIDSSIWLAEDPFTPFETWLASTLIPASLSDATLMVGVEVFGISLWLAIGAVVYFVLRRLPLIRRLDAIVVRAPFAVGLALLTLGSAYFGGFWRLAVVKHLEIRSVPAAQATAILTFVLAGSVPLVIALVWGRSSHRDGHEI
jgi:hypothetical protein